MNSRNQWIAYFISITLLLAAGCKDDTDSDNGNDVGPGQAIAGTWFVKDSTGVTGPTADQFQNFQLSITALASRVNYTAQGNNNKIVFPDAGSLEVETRDNFVNGAEVIRQPDLVPMTMTLNEADTTLRIVFTISADSFVPVEQGRIAGIAGEYTFNLKKQQTLQNQ
uniref:Uncharacterized protein n=1 Tax=Roseihalotalea indica TaxID=2867963 RepID=A0AA49PYL3_9BACT|nr:hypothetical protein K4G66_13665 [Tunicatimonas sp. TK19036]